MKGRLARKVSIIWVQNFFIGGSRRARAEEGEGGRQRGRRRGRREEAGIRAAVQGPLREPQAERQAPERDPRRPQVLKRGSGGSQEAPARRCVRPRSRAGRGRPCRGGPP